MIPCLHVHGHGILRLKPEPSFVMDVRTDRRANAFAGSIKYVDRSARLFFRSTTITGITVAGHTATITGSGLATGMPVTFLVTASDASPDTFSITLSKGYSAAGSLRKGEIRISDRCEHHGRPEHHGRRT